MELTWINKLRIAAVATLGIVVIGVLCWPLVAPSDPQLPVRATSIGLTGTLLLLALAFGVGLAGYFIAWPHGREIGILGVPLGLTVWAGRSGSMQALTQAYTQAAERTTLAHSLRIEPFYWLLLVAVGFAGGLVAQRLGPAAQSPAADDSPKKREGENVYANAAIALAVAILVSLFFLGIFAQNLTMSRNVTAQPDGGQILFGVIAAFAAAAFIVKKFLGFSYLWPALATSFVLALAQFVYYRAAAIQRFAETYPATFFPHSIFAILPVQLVARGTLGSVRGFWRAVRYDYWRKHETG